MLSGTDGHEVGRKIGMTQTQINPKIEKFLAGIERGRDDARDDRPRSSKASWTTASALAAKTAHPCVALGCSPPGVFRLPWLSPARKRGIGSSCTAPTCVGTISALALLLKAAERPRPSPFVTYLGRSDIPVLSRKYGETRRRRQSIWWPGCKKGVRRCLNAPSGRGDPQ